MTQFTHIRINVHEPKVELITDDSGSVFLTPHSFYEMRQSRDQQGKSLMRADIEISGEPDQLTVRFLDEDSAEAAGVREPDQEEVVGRTKSVPASEETKKALGNAVIFLGAPPIWRDLNRDADEALEPDTCDEPKAPDEERDESE